MRTEEFYSFMKKRETIRLNKERGFPWPWTDDPILQEYKFTNVKREFDKTTKYFWDVLDMAMAGEASPETLLFNCALFRYFGTQEFYKYIGWQKSWDKDDQEYVKNAAKDRLSKGERVFTGAYVITNQGIKAPKQEVVVDCFLTPFWDACPDLTKIAKDTRSWESVAQAMMKLKGFGGSGFMTKEILQDALHTRVFANGCDDRNSYCPVGPGALRGCSRLMGNNNPDDFKLKQDEALEMAVYLFGHRTMLWPKDWVELELHDIQFQLCEFDKYERVRLGQGRPRSRYRRPE